MSDLKELEPMVRAIVHKTLADMLGINAIQEPQRQWYRAAQAAKLLDLETADNLHDLRLSGDLREGAHWRDTSSKNSKRPSYQYNVGNCRKLLESRRS
ncbi:MAG: hypothetical protein F6J95_007705 [Leptolyngbya sp. SIO1E4]|nr:hypothetical protein [Leptolyngbya sp. SIO1E4]